MSSVLNITITFSSVEPWKQCNDDWKTSRHILDEPVPSQKPVFQWLSLIAVWHHNICIFRLFIEFIMQLVLSFEFFQTFSCGGVLYLPYMAVVFLVHYYRPYGGFHWSHSWDLCLLNSWLIRIHTTFSYFCIIYKIRITPFNAVYNISER